MLRIIFVLACLGTSALALDIKTLDGKDYKSVTVVRTDPYGITVVYDGGAAKILFTNLPPDLQQKYHYDPAAIAWLDKVKSESAAKEAASQKKASDEMLDAAVSAAIERATLKLRVIAIFKKISTWVAISVCGFMLVLACRRMT